MSRKVDYVVVGAGLFGSTFARCVADAGKQVLLLDRRPHLAGNCYSEQVEGIEVHRYGPHIFHTSNKQVWEFVNQFSEFNHYKHRGVVRYEDRLFSFPINLTTLHQLWGVTTPTEAQERLAAVREPCERPENLEQWILGQVGRELYEIFIQGYTTKQWGRDPSKLPASIIRRIPIRLTWNDNYFNDIYQGIPAAGYTRMFEKMLDHPLIRVETEVDYLTDRGEFDRLGATLVYSGKIDEYFDYRFGELEYRSLRFETESLSGDFQGASIVNYGSSKVPYTRIVEHKHFALQESDRTVITREYPQKYAQGREAFYPIRDERNTELYEKYRSLAKQTDVLFGGRLGTYQYFDMHQVVAQAMAVAKNEYAGRSSDRQAA
jgi:UDP-galactopyranose mutase